MDGLAAFVKSAPYIERLFSAFAFTEGAAMNYKSIIRGEAGDLSRRFDLTIQATILISVAALVLETMDGLPSWLVACLLVIEVASTVMFTFEYGLRVMAAEKKSAYVFSFWGIVDFAAIIPTLMVPGVDMRALRALRLLRIVRILKLGRYSRAMQRLSAAINSIRDEFVCFMLLAGIVFLLAASGIYYFENDAQPEAFSSIPAAMWWAVATLTTVGYGDVYPVTAGGRIFTGIVLMIGLGLVAVPTGLVAAALQEHADRDPE